MHLSPDDLIFWQYGFLKLNATILATWGLMLILAVGSKAVTRSFPSDWNARVGKICWRSWLSPSISISKMWVCASREYTWASSARCFYLLR